MNYQAIGKNGQIVKVRHRYTIKGEEIEEIPMPTLFLRCASCGWETKAIKSAAPLPTCLCGGYLQTINLIA